MRTLVTGAAGFLGFHIARRLAAGGSQVICIDNFVRGECDRHFKALVALPNVERIDMDLTEQAAVRTLPDDVSTVYHMAALNGTQNFYDRPFEVMRCCTLPTIFLLEKYGKSPDLKRFLYAGTSEVYASTVTQFGWEVPTGEEVAASIDDVWSERWSYGASKLHGEIATVQAAKAFGTRVSIARFHNAFGPRMGDKHVISDFLKRAKSGIFALYGHEDTRTFIYVDDAIDATIRVAESVVCDGEVVNIGGRREISMYELAQTIMCICGFSGEIQLNPSPKGSVKRRAPKLDKLQRLTGFQESWTLEDGLLETARFYLGDGFVPPDRAL